MDDQKTIEDEIVELDYVTLENVIYRNCKLIYKGGRPPELKNVTLTECEFIFEDRARNTLEMMRLIAHSGDAELVVKGMLGLKDWSPND